MFKLGLVFRIWISVSFFNGQVTCMFKVELGFEVWVRVSESLGFGLGLDYFFLLFIN